MRSKKGKEWEQQQLRNGEGLVGFRANAMSPKFLLFAKVCGVLYLALFALFLIMLVVADILPLYLVIIIILVLGIASLLLFPMLYFRNIKRNRKITAVVISIVLMAVYIYGAIGFASIAGFFFAVTGGGDKYAKPVNVLRKPYNIYISGLDVSGSIKKKSRSDVNMIMTVNPKLNKVLLTSIPRDTVIQMPDKGGVNDKLTHTGIYGIGTTLGAVENLFGVDMNYYVKVNYTTVKKFIDAIGGIDVKSDFEFDTHGMKAKYHFKKGMNHMNGSQALAFARERKSFTDGDFQRNKNQAKVMQAMIKKASSSKTILMSYAGILNSCKGYMKMNLTDREIKRIIKKQIAKGEKWKTGKQSLKGTPALMQCFSTGAVNVSVVQPSRESMAKCKKRMYRILEKKME